jgi:hypothetical protein
MVIYYKFTQQSIFGSVCFIHRLNSRMYSIEDLNIPDWESVGLRLSPNKFRYLAEYIWSKKIYFRCIERAFANCFLQSLFTKIARFRLLQSINYQPLTLHHNANCDRIGKGHKSSFTLD